ncbi:hypothetical protein FRC00_001031 [Tulasnella sp. 408]|nr:hypothetical protein FRC00_001031 [Tulasnella sp. 408]
MTGSTARYFMHIHNMSQQRMVTMYEATFPEGPRHQEVWTSTITSGSMFTWGRRAVSGSFNGLGIGTHTAQANTKQAARDAASFRALVALGIDVNSLPN